MIMTQKYHVINVIIRFVRLIAIRPLKEIHFKRKRLEQVKCLNFKDWLSLYYIVLMVNENINHCRRSIYIGQCKGNSFCEGRQGV